MLKLNNLPRSNLGNVMLEICNLNNDNVEISIPDLNGWIEKMDTVYWRVSKLRDGQFVNLNLSNIKFFRPSGVILLLLICIDIFGKTNNTVMLIGLDDNVLAYLERVGFLEYDFIKLDLSLPWWKRFPRISAKSLSIIEITQIGSSADVADFAERVNEILNVWYPGKDRELYRGNVNTIIMEICNNSIDHSSEIEGNYGECFCMLQKYTHRNRIVEVSLSIGDLGIGIREHLTKRHGWSRSSEAEYIQMAIDGLSGRMDDSGGLGLPRIKSITSKNNGVLLVKSGKGAIILDDEIKLINFNHGFNGTQCYLNLSPKD